MTMRIIVNLVVIIVLLTSVYRRICGGKLEHLQHMNVALAYPPIVIPQRLTEPPRITPQLGIITVLPGSTSQLFCHDTEPIDWMWMIVPPKAMHYQIRDIDIKADGIHHMRSLVLSNHMNHTATIDLYCGRTHSSTQLSLRKRHTLGMVSRIRIKLIHNMHLAKRIGDGHHLPSASFNCSWTAEYNKVAQRQKISQPPSKLDSFGVWFVSYPDVISCLYSLNRLHAQWQTSEGDPISSNSSNYLAWSMSTTWNTWRSYLMVFRQQAASYTVHLTMKSSGDDNGAVKTGVTKKATSTTVQFMWMSTEQDDEVKRTPNTILTDIPSTSTEISTTETSTTAIIVDETDEESTEDSTVPPTSISSPNPSSYYAQCTSSMSNVDNVDEVVTGTSATAIVDETSTRPPCLLEWPWTLDACSPAALVAVAVVVTSLVLGGLIVCTYVVSFAIDMLKYTLRIYTVFSYIIV